MEIVHKNIIEIEAYIVQLKINTDLNYAEYIAGQVDKYREWTQVYELAHLERSNIEINLQSRKPQGDSIDLLDKIQSLNIEKDHLQFRISELIRQGSAHRLLILNNITRYHFLELIGYSRHPEAIRILNDAFGLLFRKSFLRLNGQKQFPILDDGQVLSILREYNGTYDKLFFNSDLALSIQHTLDQTSLEQVNRISILAESLFQWFLQLVDIYNSNIKLFKDHMSACQSYSEEVLKLDQLNQNSQIIDQENQRLCQLNEQITDLQSKMKSNQAQYDSYHAQLLLHRLQIYYLNEFQFINILHEQGLPLNQINFWELAIIQSLQSCKLRNLNKLLKVRIQDNLILDEFDVELIRRYNVCLLPASQILQSKLELFEEIVEQIEKLITKFQLLTSLEEKQYQEADLHKQINIQTGQCAQLIQQQFEMQQKLTIQSSRLDQSISYQISYDQLNILKQMKDPQRQHYKLCSLISQILYSQQMSWIQFTNSTSRTYCSIKMKKRIDYKIDINLQQQLVEFVSTNQLDGNPFLRIKQWINEVIKVQADIQQYFDLKITKEILDNKVQEIKRDIALKNEVQQQIIQEINNILAKLNSQYPNGKDFYKPTLKINISILKSNIIQLLKYKEDLQACLQYIDPLFRLINIVNFIFDKQEVTFPYIYYENLSFLEIFVPSVCQELVRLYNDQLTSYSQAFNDYNIQLSDLLSKIKNVKLSQQIEVDNQISCEFISLPQIEIIFGQSLPRQKVPYDKIII